MKNSGQSMNTALRRGLVSAVVFFLLLGLLMFLPAGAGWWEGWLFLVVFLAEMAAVAAYLWRTNPEIYIARSGIHRGTKGWDKVVMSFLFPSLMAIFPVAAMDHRYHWSTVPGWLIAVGYGLFTLGMAGSTWVEGVNKFAEPGVRIQSERGHKVIDTGPYAYVRHPLYVAGFFLFGGIPLALGSLWALVPTAVTGVVLVIRTALEDRTLQEELEGYREYARRVRYRLVPGVW